MVVRGIAQHLGGEGALIGPPRVGVGARGPTALHGHGAGVVDGGVDGGRSEKVLDGPEGGQDRVKNGVPDLGGIIVHRRVERAQEGGGTEASGVAASHQVRTPQWSEPKDASQWKEGGERVPE